MIRFFAGHPTAANLLMLIFLIAGIATVPQLSRETFPDFSINAVEIRVIYPGASPETVEEALCFRIEDAIDGLRDVDESRCEAREGVAIATIEMMDSGDLNRFLRDVASKINAIADFPTNAENPVITELNRTDRVAAIAVSGPMAPADLRAYAEGVKTRILRTGTISQVSISGFSQQIVRIDLNHTAVRRYGLSASEVADAIRRMNLNLPAGNLTLNDREILVRVDDERHLPGRLAELVIRGGAKGGTVRLGQLARISTDFQDAENKVLLNGQRAALLQISKTKNQDTLTVRDAIDAFLKKERQTAPPTVVYKITRDISSIVRDRLQMLIRNGLQGLVAVFLVMWLFFSFRLALWVSLTLPISFLGTFVVMVLFGYSINMLTMVALLISIGLIMDDSIVIAENIAAQRDKGKEALESVVDGVREVSVGVISSFLTTACVFLPLAFLEGNIGKVMKVVPVVLLITLTVSLIEAFLILPHHIRHGGSPGGSGAGRFKKAFENRFNWVREKGLGRLVTLAVKRRYLTAGLVLFAFLVSAAMMAGGVLKFRAFPDLEGDVIEARILLPQGTPLAKTEAAVTQVTEALTRTAEQLSARQSDGKKLLRQVLVQFSLNRDAYETGPHLATVTADLLTSEQRATTLDEFKSAWRAETGVLPDALSLTFKDPQIGPAGGAIEIRLQGDDLNDLKSASTELAGWFGRYRGVTDLHDDLKPGKQEIRVRLRTGATQLGLDARTIGGQLRTALQGEVASEVFIAGLDAEIRVSLESAGRDSLTDLEDFPITLASGQQAPLGSIAMLTLDRGVSRIGRIEGRRTVILRGDVDALVANVSEIMNDTRQRFLPDLLKKYPGMRIATEGEVAEQAETRRSMIRGFLIGIFGVFILLSFQFRDYIEPLIVLVAIPMALIGVIWGHLLMGLEISMPSMLGFASLAGIVVNDSILLIVFIKLRTAKGIPIVEAASQASLQRFRPVLLTSLTTIAGLIPLLFETSVQAQILVPLVASLAFGLMASTFMVLVVVPVLYAILHDLSPRMAGISAPPEPPEQVPSNP
jgi:multidrug efflux pump subunit AcrB